ncbi:hypothetical protein FHG87_009653 [Trinorchestia longiramus]|nr:hypothetical protein FHG87_009653 [Trinorchestia longiramus]
MERRLEAARGRMRLYTQRIRNEQRQEVLERERQRQQMRRAAMNDVQREEYREQQRNLSQQIRENMDAEQRAQHLERQRNLFQQREQNMNEEDRMNYHQNQRERYRQTIENMNFGEVNHLRQNQLQRQRIRRNGPVVDIANIIDIEPFDISEMNVRCEYCDALRFRNEDKNCCHKGKVSVPALQPYPEALRDLLERNDQESTSFRKKHQELQLCILLSVFWSQTVRSSWKRSLLLSHPRPDLSLNDKSVPW